ncbi:MAG: hypothetical protein JRI23_20210, partial [Deltaproteobacteria bacterium]|nr:hypothetical protein [Deltaproteobacteria bacterium]MBW2534206.1 hypothetical protein [Deltaproteobacteria bacterium]
MKRLCHWIAVVGLCAATTAGCSNYRDDLDRAASHYNRNQYENAIALLQPLELDLDSLSDQERAQYAYYRGMSHFRLNQRRDARHWLGVAAAGEKATNGSLGVEENKRVADTLDELNRAVFGLAESVGPKGRPCKSDADCDQGQFCDAEHCTKTPGDEADAEQQEAPPPAPAGTGAPPEPPPPAAPAPT